MKNLILLPFLLFLIACTPKRATLTVCVVGSEDTIVRLFCPVEKFPLGVTDTLFVKEGHSSTATISVEKLSTMKLMNKNVYTTLIVEPGAAYHVTFDHTTTPVVSVDDSAQMVLNRIFADKNYYKYEFTSDYSVAPLDTIASRMLANFEELIAYDKVQFDGVEMSRDKRAFIDRHIELFWLGSLSKAIRSNYVDMLPYNHPMHEGFAELWQQIYTKYPPTADMMPSNLLPSYAEMMLSMIQMQSGDGKAEEMPSDYWQRRYDALHEAIKDPQLRKALIAATLYYDCLKNSTNDNAILGHIDRFNTEYPDNKYADRFEPFVRAVLDFNERIKGDFAPRVRFVPGGDDINTFREVLAHFKGKALFVDFWFSTCGPCREQFKYGAPLDAFLTEHGVEMLYISIDRQQVDWHNSIKAFELEGNHIRTNPSLHKDIYENYGVGNFPRYMIIDADGQIVVPQAKEPGEGRALYDQIKESLKL